MQQQLAHGTHGTHGYRITELVFAVLVALGVAATVLAITMDHIGNDDAPWHFLIALIGIPTALAASGLAFMQAAREL